ncbi:MFS transporter [Halomarina ordinaria]|uniref:MFS transporter n=1 Tax=Halomarina ordinaria TaxID=3033939 RepID=A0ABD5UAZ4_9EURY|nr:MFS transporter [Halomarina sp. PSRA2]
MVLGTDRRILTLALARMADALGNSFLIIVLPLYIESGEVDVTGLVGGSVLGVELTLPLLVGLVLSLFGFLNSFGQPITGRISDRTGERRRFVLFGLALFGVASATYPFVSSYEAVLLTRAFQGLGAAFTIPATIALVNEFAASDTERGGNFGVFNTFRLVGFGFGPIVAGVVIQQGPYATPAGRLSGFDAAFGIAVLGAAVSFLLVTLLIEDPDRTDAAAAEDLSFDVFDPTGRQTFDPVFVLGVGTLFMAITIALFATLQDTITARLDEGELLFSVQFAAVVIANVLFQVPIGRASDRYGRKPFLLAGFALLVPSVALQGYVPALTPGIERAIPTLDGVAGPGLMLVARLLHGVAVALVFAPALALAGDLAREGESGTTLSVLTMAFGLGVAIGPLASGYLVRFGFPTPFVVGAGLAAVGLVLTYSQVEESLSDTLDLRDAVPQDD